MAANIHRLVVIMFHRLHHRNLHPAHRMIHSNEPKINEKVSQPRLPTSFDAHQAEIAAIIVAAAAVAAAEVMNFSFGLCYNHLAIAISFVFIVIRLRRV